MLSHVHVDMYMTEHISVTLSVNYEGECCRNRDNGFFFCLCVSGADSEKRSEQLERTSSISEEYMRYLNNPENEEKRFPVDRKKLERLILGEAIWSNIVAY